MKPTARLAAHALRAALFPSLLFVSAPADSRLEAPTDDLRERMVRQQQATQVEIERLRIERQYEQQQEAEYTALAPDARNALLAKEFDELFRNTADWELKCGDTFLPEALKRLRLEFTDGGLVVVSRAQGTELARVKVGDLVPVAHPEVSTYQLAVTAVDAEKKTISLSAGDAVYTVGAAGEVTPPGKAQLLATYRALVGAYSPGGPPLSYSLKSPGIRNVAALLENKGKVPVRVSRHIPEAPAEFRAVARPIEFALGKFCLEAGARDGRAIVWEKRGDGYVLRLFPLGEDPLLHDPPLFTVEGIAPGTGEATVRLGEDIRTVQVLDFLPVPIGGNSHISAIVESVSPRWQEIILNAGGRKLVYTGVPPGLGDHRVNGAIKNRRLDSACKELSVNLQITVKAGAEVAAEPVSISAEDATAARILPQLCRLGQWSFRWSGEKTVVIDYPENLLTPEFEAQRAAAP